MRILSLALDARRGSLDRLYARTSPATNNSLLQRFRRGRFAAGSFELPEITTAARGAITIAMGALGDEHRAVFSAPAG